MKASFNGEIHEIPGIAVDNFEHSKRAYFLSHCHADHTTGLNTLFSRINSTVFIYMSEVSAAIVETSVDEKLKGLIRPLKLGSTTITIPGDDENDIPEQYVGVTLIPAGHCFGSVMFLFETPRKKVLYTGDFRITENSVNKMAQLHNEDMTPLKLDVLYVDTTFQDCSYETFPKRSDILDGLEREIKAWLKASDANRVALTTSARYGYESIFNEIYKRLSMKVYVESNWMLYSKFLDRLPGVTNERTTKIHLCTKSRRFCTTCYNNDAHKYLYIHFSAMMWRNLSPEDLSIVKNGDRINVCFATHCSRSELLYFVNYLSPKKVVGFSEPYVPEEKLLAKRSAEKNGEERPKKVPKEILRLIFE